MTPPSVYERYKHLLLLQSDYPLSPIYSSKNLAKEVARDTEQTDKVNVIGKEKDLAIFGSIRVRVGGFGDLYRKLLQEIEVMQENLFAGIGFQDREWFSSFAVPQELVDLVNSNQAGYFFGEEKKNDLKRYSDLGIRALLHHPRLKGRYGCMVSQDKFVPNAAACHDFLQRASLTRTKLAVATHISVGGPARGVEFVAQYLRNHPQGDIRNVKAVHGNLCLVGGYNKTTSIVGGYPSVPAPTYAHHRQKKGKKSIGSSPRAFIDRPSSIG